MGAAREEATIPESVVGVPKTVVLVDSAETNTVGVSADNGWQGLVLQLRLLLGCLCGHTAAWCPHSPHAKHSTAIVLH